MQVAGAAGAGAALAGTAGASPDVSTEVLDSQFDASGLQESLVVFDDAESAQRLETLDLQKTYHVFEHLDIAWTFLDPDQLQTVAGWDSVRRVKKAEELEWYNDETSRKSMAVDAAHDLGYEGEDAHVAIIDSGINGSHPGIRGRVEANYRYVDEPTGPRAPFWVDARDGDTDELGHGIHCVGIAAGDGGGGFRGDYTGMAPKARITSYSTTQYIYLPYVVAAWNHLLGRIRTEPDFQPDVVSNSYGVARNNIYNPNDPVNIATWKVFQEGVLPVFAYGNDGEAGEGTGNRFAKAPHVLGVGAAEKTIDPEDNANNRPIVDFSSRGRSDVPDVFYNREQLLRNLREFFAIQEGQTYTIDSGTINGRVGPAVNTGPALIGAVDEDTGSQFHRLSTFDNVDLIDLTLSLEPEGQWVRLRVYQKQDGDWVEIAQMREEPLKQHDTLTVDVNGGRDVMLELEPEDNVTAEYTVEYEQYEKSDGDLEAARPITLYRPGLSTHGNQVMSTQDKYDVLGPIGEFAFEGEPFYGRLSGTSMATPGAAGIAMLVQQAHRENSGGDELSPIDLIRVLEHAAADHNPNYTTVNTGAGFVDTAKAVATAEQLATGQLTIADLDTGLDALVEPPGKVTPPDIIDLTASGTRSSDSSVNFDDRTQRVTVTIDSFNTDATDEVEVYDEIPSSWKLDPLSTEAEVADDQGDTGEDRTRLRLFKSSTDKTISASEVEGDESVTFRYFVRTPEGMDSTRPYTLGPAEAVLTEWAFAENEDREHGAESDTFGGEDNVLIAGTPL